MTGRLARATLWAAGGLLSLLPFAGINAQNEQSISAYEETIAGWNSPEAVNQWIAAHFRYDWERAQLLAESSDSRPPVMEPARLFAIKSGTCVDLSRFAVQTLERVRPDSEPAYVLIEFEPVQIRGGAFRRHWLVSYRQDGELYFFADSSRIGDVMGPFEDLESFAEYYSEVRNRRIVSCKLVDDFRKSRRRMRRSVSDDTPAER